MKRSSSLAMPQYSTEPRTRQYVKGDEFLWFARKTVIDARHCKKLLPKK